LKATGEKREVTYNGKLTKIAVDFSTETLKIRKEWNDIVQALKENTCQLKLMYPLKLSLIMKEK
jgi:hypothetical protein